MTTPRVAARFHRLALLLCLPACHSWRPVELAPARDFGPSARVRVERQDLSWVAVSGPRVVGDSLLGLRGRSSAHTAVALADVRRADQRRFSGRRTSLLVGGIVATAAIVAVTSYRNRDEAFCLAVSLELPCNP